MPPSSRVRPSVFAIARWGARAEAGRTASRGRGSLRRAKAPGPSSDLPRHAENRHDRRRRRAVGAARPPGGYPAPSAGHSWSGGPRDPREADEALLRTTTFEQATQVLVDRCVTISDDLLTKEIAGPTTGRVHELAFCVANDGDGVPRFD